MSYIEKARRIRAEIEKKGKESFTQTLIDPIFNIDQFKCQFPYEINELNEIKGVAQAEAVRLYREQGWIQIYSTHLGTRLYIVRDDQVKVPSSAIPKYTQNELEALKGLDLDELRTLHEAKMIFTGKIQ